VELPRKCARKCALRFFGRGRIGFAKRRGVRENRRLFQKNFMATQALFSGCRIFRFDLFLLKRLVFLWMIIERIREPALDRRAGQFTFS